MMVLCCKLLLQRRSSAPFPSAVLLLHGCTWGCRASQSARCCYTANDGSVGTAVGPLLPQPLAAGGVCGTKTDTHLSLSPFPFFQHIKYFPNCLWKNSFGRIHSPAPPFSLMTHSVESKCTKKSNFKMMKRKASL